MKRLLILAEGHTEKRVVGSILRDHLRARGVDPVPTILDTSPPDVGPRFKGGVSTWSKIQEHLKRLLGDTAAVGVTTMIDYYGLPNDVPGMEARPVGPPQTRVEHVERAIAAQFNDRRLRPYLMLHELEAMLFTDISKWEHRFDDAAVIAALKNEVRNLLPEAINETRDGAPSRRIKSRLHAYSKGIGPGFPRTPQRGAGDPRYLPSWLSQNRARFTRLCFRDELRSLRGHDFSGSGS
jgi:Domain of unknown function (DUF4276)